MIKNKKVLAIIPARGGSKGIPHKNLTLLGGKPLIEWTITEAKKSKYIDHLILSSDDETIIACAKKLNCLVPFVRPAHLAQDNTPGIDVVLHAIDFFKGEFDIVVLLQPTSPFRNTDDIDGCIENCILTNSTSVSIVLPNKSPYWMYEMDSEKKLLPLLNTAAVRRQDLPLVYALNGAVYVAKINDILKYKNFLTAETVGYVMPEIRSIDIDSPLDLLFAESILKTELLK